MPYLLRSVCVAALIFAATTISVHAADVQVNSLAALQKAIDAAKPGDQIVLSDGKYASTAPIKIGVAGTRDKPIVIMAQTVGGVEINGEAGLHLAPPAAFVVIQGFNFRHKPEMVSEAGVHHCRFTRNLFDMPVTGRLRYLAVHGDDNEIDHNEFRNKSTEGQMCVVDGPGGDQMALRNWVHDNYFHDFTNAHGNNASALHVGNSQRSMSSGWTVVEYNLFERTEGENEGAICNKASDNVYRFNTFGEKSSELSLRHGKRVLVYGNFFIGGNGIRFFSQDHRIYSNYFADCRPAVSIGNGDATIPPGKLTAHERPDHVQFVYNTLVNNRANVKMNGRRNGLGSNDLTFANNLIVGGDKAVTIEGPLGNPRWEGNILWENAAGPGDIPASGFTAVDPGLTVQENGHATIGATSAAIGKGVGSFPYVTIDVDGHPRGEKKDIGADQFSSEKATHRVLTPADVGQKAPAEDRPWISAPQAAAWIGK